MIDRFGTRLKLWNMKPISLARKRAFLLVETRETSLPPRIYSPVLALSSNPMIFKRVVLPQPDGPIIIMNSPRLTVKSKLRNAYDSASPKP